MEYYYMDDTLWGLREVDDNYVRQVDKAKCHACHATLATRDSDERRRTGL